MYASYAQVRFDPGKKNEAIQMLHHDLIPIIRQAPGFVKGIWLGNDELGHGVVIFETREQAIQATQGLQPVGGVYEVVTSDVYEVHGEA
jgi:hypothetical protein